MLSRTYKKTVFIDFGLSKIVKEVMGFKTVTSFCGSVRLCTNEMMDCFLQKRNLKVDLYYNDLHCLQGSLF